MKEIKTSIFIIVLGILFSASANDFIEAELRIKDHKFIPETLILPAGKKIKLIVYNEDPTIEEFESFDLKREKIVLGKSKINVILAPLKEGEYKFFGEFHEETAQGKIIIKEDLKKHA